MGSAAKAEIDALRLIWSHWESAFNQKITLLRNKCKAERSTARRDTEGNMSLVGILFLCLNQRAIPVCSYLAPKKAFFLVYSKIFPPLKQNLSFFLFSSSALFREILAVKKIRQRVLESYCCLSRGRFSIRFVP